MALRNYLYAKHSSDVFCNNTKQQNESEMLVGGNEISHKSTTPEITTLTGNKGEKEKDIEELGCKSCADCKDCSKPKVEINIE